MIPDEYDKISIAEQYKLANSGLYSNSNITITGVADYTMEHVYRYIPGEDEKNKQEHLEKWASDNGMDKKELDKMIKNDNHKVERKYKPSECCMM